LASFDDIGALPSGEGEIITDYPIQTTTTTTSQPPAPPITETTETTSETETGPEILWVIGLVLLFVLIIWAVFARRRQTI
jgi:hypothetical protein